MSDYTPRILIAAPKSGSGKTLITCGILKVLHDDGKKVAGFKCGPDYIDPMFHEQVLKVPSKNLDTFFTENEQTKRLFLEDAKLVDVSIIEGVMGYYDGIAGIDVKASSYDLSKTLEAPTILVVDGRGASVSICAIISGFLTYQKPSYIQGIILNQVSARMYDLLKQMIEETLPVKVYGYLPVMQEAVLESRHLGLTTPDALSDIDDTLIKVAGQCRQTIDIKGLIELAKTAPKLEVIGEDIKPIIDEPVVIAVAKDRAFSFYYKDNLRLLEKLGGKIVYFSPLQDEHLPKHTAGILLGGGYPENFAVPLSENNSLKHEIKEALEKGIPCIAECGGFLYLQETLTNLEGKKVSMVGYLEGHSYYAGRSKHFGYVSLECKKKQWHIKGHEFHYMESTQKGNEFRVTKPLSERTWDSAYGSDLFYGGFPHLYLYSNVEIAKRFIQKARERKDYDDGRDNKEN